MNINGENPLPWVTPSSIEISEEHSSLTFTYCDRPDEYDLNQDCAAPSIL